MPTGRSFIFNVTVVDPDTFASRELKVKLLVKNIEQFLNPAPVNSVSTQRSYISPPDQDQVRQNVQIQYLGLEEDMFGIVNSTDEVQHFYEIKNKYFLMDPFLTSGKDMIINDKMKASFATVLDEKSVESGKYYKS